MNQSCPPAEHCGVSATRKRVAAKSQPRGLSVSLVDSVPFLTVPYDDLARDVRVAKWELPVFHAQNLVTSAGSGGGGRVRAGNRRMRERRNMLRLADHFH
jgi:hypothetical protein